MTKSRTENSPDSDVRGAATVRPRFARPLRVAAYRGGRMITAAMVVAVVAVAVVVLYLVYRSAPGATHSARSRQRLSARGGRSEGWRRGAAVHTHLRRREAGEPVGLPRPHGAAVLPGGPVVSAVLGPDPRPRTRTRPRCGPPAWTRSSRSPPTAPTLIGRKAADERLATPVLSDPDLAVSRAYDANQYGMMGDMRDGHSFVLVGPDGAIRWRADYGGAPKYTMFLPTDKMLADLTTERAQ